ncbi:MAG TPA: anti-sigma factor [Burkholderiales bacterium]|nr:anti-sigma factor [Burkholderiales bacterium]
MEKDNANQEDAELKALQQGLHQLYDPVLDEPVPERLRPRPPRWRAAAIAAGWVALGLGAGTVAGWQLNAWRTSVPAQAEVPSFVKRAAIAHAVYSPEVRHPVEVAADQEQHLVTWLSKRLGVKVYAPKLDEAGMSLVGGRLLPGDNGPVAQFMYQSQNGRRLTLYVRAETKRQRETAFRYARDNSVGVFYWVDRDCSYALASADLGKDEMLRIANLVYKQLEQ